MDAAEWVPIIVALGGGTGIGAGIKAATTVTGLLRRGVSPREGKRKVDIVQQRDEAYALVSKERDRAESAIDSAERSAARADAEMTRADWAEENRQIAVENEQRAKEHAADLRVRLVEGGVRRRDLPDWPVMADPIPRSELNRRIQEGQRAKHPTVDDEPTYYETKTREEVDAERWRPTDADADRRRPRH